MRVTFQPSGVSVDTDGDNDLLTLAREAGVALEGSCNGQGTCGKCKVELLGGSTTPPAAEELDLLTGAEITRGVRLACHAHPVTDVHVRVVQQLDTSTMRIVEDASVYELADANPFVSKVRCELRAPALGDSASLIELLEDCTGRSLSASLRLRTLQALPELASVSDPVATAILFGDEIGALEADSASACYGVTADIGTTTVVVSLVDLLSGAELRTASAANPQASYGQDVLSRIEHARNPKGLRALQEAIVSTLNALIARVCESAGVARSTVYELVVAGNATMLHLLLGVSPSSLGSAPYATVFKEGLAVGAAELGIEIAGCGQVYALPSISAYVGADIVAGIVATRLHEADEPTLLIDVGTNGEIVFGSRDALVACSCAAGPALEGMNIACGTVAVDGAVEAVRIETPPRIITVGDAPPVGICGSGIIDAVAELVDKRIVHPSGRFRERDEFVSAGGDPSLLDWLVGDEDPRFLLTSDKEGGAGSGEPIFVSQGDVRHVQLAKGAIASGIRVLLDAVGVEPADVARVYLAGAFGKHLRLESLVRIGMVPSELGDKVDFVGNSAKAGAVLSLLSREKRAEAERVARGARYIELSNHPEYESLFVRALPFPA